MSSGNSKPWGGGIGAWALEAEQAEAEERAAAEAAAAKAAIAGESSQSFPSLKEAVAAGKPKKKKGTTLTLSEFTVGTYVGPGGGRQHKETIFDQKGLTTEEMLRLPTGPRERSAEEMEQGRGFRNYGSYGSGGGGGGFRDRRDDGDGRRNYGGGGFDDDTRRGPRAHDSEQMMPSRADEVDNWASSKKSLGFGTSQMESGRRDRYGSLGSGGGGGGGGGGGMMRADEADNWSMGKKQVFPARSSGFGSGFRDTSSDSDRWVRGRTGVLPTSHNGEHERPRLVLDPPKRDAGVVASSELVKTRLSPFGAARPREEVLAEKGVDWKKVDSETETKRISRPTSSHSTRPSSAHSSRGGSPAPPQMVAADLDLKPRPKINPFGDAKPREILLEEKGKDWRKIDMELEHRSVNRPETEQEKLLKEEISYLRDTMIKSTDGNVDSESTEYSTEQLNKLLAREKELEQLIHDLDDQVKFGQKAISEIRPGSAGSGRMSAFSDRPPSRSSIPDESRSMDFAERPGSRGSVGDTRSRPQDDRRGFRLSREGGFFGSRDIDRSRTRERW